jgi:uncharacterized protein YndB with AHSA1/START domain
MVSVLFPVTLLSTSHIPTMSLSPSSVLPFSSFSAQPAVIDCGVDQLAVAAIVHAPRTQVFERWRRFDEFPHFMRGGDDGLAAGGSRMVWRIRFDCGWYPWDAEVNLLSLDDGIFWQHNGGGRPCRNAGSVVFRSESDGSTRITISCEFQPPVGAGPLAESLDSLAVRLRSGLERFYPVAVQETEVTADGMAGPVVSGGLDLPDWKPLGCGLFHYAPIPA